MSKSTEVHMIIFSSFDSVNFRRCLCLLVFGISGIRKSVLLLEFVYVLSVKVFKNK